MRREKEREAEERKAEREREREGEERERRERDGEGGKPAKICDYFRPNRQIDHYNHYAVSA